MLAVLIRRTMTPAELLIDVDDTTRPDAPAPMRIVQCMEALEHEQTADTLIAYLCDRPGGDRLPLTQRLKRCRSEFRAWQRDLPTPDVKERVLTRFGLARREVSAVLMAGMVAG